MFFGIVGLTIVVLVKTPLGGYVEIPNPEVERKYGAQLRETRERLERLAEDVLLLRDYNNQLRKALGASEWSDTSNILGGRASLILSATAGASEPDTTIRGQTEMAIPTDEQGYDAGFTSEYQSVVTSPEGFRAVFPILPPVEGFVTQTFDPSRNHYGIDLAAKRGTPVYAATDGYVLFAGWTYNDGNMIILSHGSGYLTIYKHNQSLLRTEFDSVRRGEMIALLGDTGKTSGGPHLHFELWKDGVPLDPQEFMLTMPPIQ